MVNTFKTSRNFRNFFISLSFLSSSCFAQDLVTMKGLLNELSDFSSVSRFPENEFSLKQVSSYDRHSIAQNLPGWFANEDHTNFIREEIVDGRKEHVMMDEDGPGVIVRFWETTFKRPGKLRLYFDNEKEARLVIKGYDLMKFPFPLGEGLLAAHSSYEPEAKGGSTLYLPLAYQKHCKVTWEDESDPIKEKRYYQINFRKYKAGTKVETFSNEILKANKENIDRVSDILLHPQKIFTKSPAVKKFDIADRKSGIVKLPKGSNVVKMIKVSLSDSLNYTDEILRSLYITAEFDGEKTVYCPLSDFFGSGAGNKAIQSWYRSIVPKGQMTCRWTMPYSKNGKLTVVNNTGKSIKFELSIITEAIKWDNSRLYFHTDWRYVKGVPIKKSEADKPIELDLNDVTGTGIFVGETLSVNNHMHTWYGEGDQKIWVDNEKFPSEYGTGLEDYYNTSWAPVVIYNSPFANATRADNEDSFGENTFNRTRNLDVVPFKNRFLYNVEMLGWANGFADIAATTYWYGKKDAKSKIVKN